MSFVSRFAVPFLVATLAAGSAGADPVSFSGMVQTDWRAMIGGPVWDDYPTTVGDDEAGDLVWNLNIAEFRLKQRLNAHIRYEAQVRLNFDGLSLASSGGPSPLENLTNSLTLDPFWLESDAAYVEAKNLFDGFDLVVGRQIVTWGASDRFRPTNNLNPDDLWDPTRFGMTQANEMIRMLYNPVGDLIFEVVVVPSFRPARLPTSATAALTDPNAPIPFLEPDRVEQVVELRNMMGGLGLQFDDTFAVVETPSTSLENVQAAARVSWRAGDTDMSLSYYWGFDDFPHPAYSTSEIDAGLIDTYVTLRYPRIQVVGFDIAGSIGFLDDAGYRIEGAFVYPDPVEMRMDIPLGDDIVGHTVDGRAFFKATLGIDYTFTRDIFALAMIVHGMIDELGDQAVGDYFVVGADFRFLNEKLLLRLFGIVALDTDHFGAVAYPLLQWNPWGSMELEAGALMMFGDAQSKFGQPAAGNSVAFLRSRVRF